MAGTTNYPGALDTTTNLPIASALVTVELDGDGDVNKIHSNLHGVLSQAAVAIEGKIGTGASTPIANRVLRGSGTGTSAWAQVALATDVSGTLPLASLATGALDSGFSITSGFGTINNGASSITTTGAVATGALTPSSIAYTGNLYFTGTLATASNTNNYMVRFNEADSSVTASASNAGTGASGYGFVTIDGEAIAAASSLTFAESSSLMITGAPTAGTNMTLTKTFALNVVAGDVSIAPTAKLYLDGGGDTYIHEESANLVRIVVGNENFLEFVPDVDTLYINRDGADIDFVYKGTSGNIVVTNAVTKQWDFYGGVTLQAAQKLYFDGGSDTYIYQESADDLHVVVGGVAMIQIDQDINAMGLGLSVAPSDYNALHIAGAFTSGGSSSVAIGTWIDHDITTHPGDTTYAVNANIGNGTITTPGGGVTYALIAGLRVGEPSITLGAAGGQDVATLAATLYIADAPDEATTNAAIYVAAGNSTFNGDVSIGSTALVTAVTGADDLIVDNGTNGGISILAATEGILAFGDAADADVGRVRYTHASDQLDLIAGGATVLRVTSGLVRAVGNLKVDSIAYINESANANMTVGLTINQGANDNQILAFKSSDVATGLTTVTAPDVETDDFAVFGKSSAAGGGLRILALNEDDSNPSPFLLRSYGGTGSTTKTTSAESLFQIGVFETNGSNGLANITANGNVFGISAYVGGAERTRLLVDEDGDLYSVTSAQTFDDYDDMALINTYDGVRSGTLKEQIKADFGRTMLMDEATLIEAGVLGDTMANGGLTNQTQLARVLTGGVRQLNQKHLSLAEKVDGLEVELIEAKKQLAAISA